jgi:hypothetical protein
MSTPAPEPARPWWRRWWNRTTAIIITLGTLAAAIGSILALLPKPDSEDSARFTAVRVTSGVPLGEYRQRSAVMVPYRSGRNEGRQRDRGAGPPVAQLAWTSADKPSLPAGLLATVDRLQSDPTTSSVTTTSAPTTTSVTTTSASTTTSATTTTSDGVPSSSQGFVVPPAFQQEDLGAYTKQVFKRVEAQDPGVKRCEQQEDCTLRRLIPQSTDEKGNPVPPDVAAERVIKLLSQVRRTTGEQPSGEKPKGEPLGVVVSTNLELVGLRGKPVLLSWSMWQQGGKKRLFGNWLNTNLAYRLVATTDHDTGTLDMWVPLPKAPGSYFIRVKLTADRSPLASADSTLFD